MNSKKYWVWLSMVFGGGSYKLWQLMSVYETVEEVYSVLISENMFMRLTENEAASIKSYSLGNAAELIRECEKRGIGIICYSDAEYPKHLRYIPDPPPVLFYKGNISCITGTKTVTSVGTRKAGSYSMSVCQKICSELAAEGYIIVSGFAVGIDITAHMAAAEQGYPTICVLGCGVDVDYPKENFVYRDKIIASGGVFVSEYPPGTKPLRGHFPKRNRILSALGRAAVVFEASESSGSMITAKLAAEQGRELFVLPPADIFSSRYSGNIKLIKEGAVPLMSAESITDFFKQGCQDTVVKADAYAYIIESSSRAAGDITDFANAYESGLKGDIITEESAVEAVPDDEDDTDAEINENNSKEKADELNTELIPEGIQRDIAVLLKEKGRLHADIICSELNIDSAELMIELTELEVLGIIKSCPGRIYELL